MAYSSSLLKCMLNLTWPTACYVPESHVYFNCIFGWFRFGCPTRVGENDTQNIDRLRQNDCVSMSLSDITECFSSLSSDFFHVSMLAVQKTKILHLKHTSIHHKEDYHHRGDYHSCLRCRLRLTPASTRSSVQSAWVDDLSDGERLFDRSSHRPINPIRHLELIP